MRLKSDVGRSTKVKVAEAVQRDVEHTPRVPPGLGHGTIVPELLQTNRMLIADLRETQEHVKALQHQTMVHEENRARMQIHDAEVARQRHEAAMALIRQNINPNAGLMEAMYQGVASATQAAHQAAHAAAESSAQHHAMDATSRNLFSLSIHQAKEALEMAANSGPPRPPPGPPPQTASQRPNEYVLPERPPPPTIDSGMSNVATRRSRSVDEIREMEREVMARPMKSMKKAVEAAAQGAEENAKASDAPATKEEERPVGPGFHPPVPLKDSEIRAYGKAIGARGRQRLNMLPQKPKAPRPPRPTARAPERAQSLGARPRARIPVDISGHVVELPIEEPRLRSETAHYDEQLRRQDRTRSREAVKAELRKPLPAPKGASKRESSKRPTKAPRSQSRGPIAVR